MQAFLSVTQEMEKRFQWTKECNEAFQSLKLYLACPLILSSLEPGEDLYMYLAVSKHVVCAVLIRIRWNAKDSVLCQQDFGGYGKDGTSPCAQY